MKKIAISTYKGGVGKTTTTRDLSAALARAGFRVLAVDLDRTQRHLMAFAEGMPGVDFKSTTAGRLAKVLLRAEADGFDYVLIDCPPNLAKEAATALRLADVVIAPAAPEYLAADGLERVSQAVELARYGHPDLEFYVLITMFDKRDPSCQLVEDAIRRRFDGVTFQQNVNRQAAFNLAALAGHSIYEQQPRSQGAQVYKSLAKAVSE